MENFNFITFNFCLIPCAPLFLNASVANSLFEKTKPIQSQFQRRIYSQRGRVKHNYLPAVFFPLTSSTA